MATGTIRFCLIDAPGQSGNRTREWTVYFQTYPNLQRLEATRLNSLQKQTALQDQTLLDIAKRHGERLMQATLFLGKGSVLILEKIALCQQNLDNLVRDEKEQRRLLGQLTDRVSTYRQVYEQERQINDALRHAAHVAQASARFEEMLSEQLNPLLGLLDHIANIGSGINSSVLEIEGLAQEFLHQKDSSPQFSGTRSWKMKPGRNFLLPAC
jgi:hypothetical protein